MSRIEIKQKIKIYEIDDGEVPVGESAELQIDSHWNINSFVVLKFGKKKLTVSGDDLIISIRNAMNTGEL